MNTDTGGGDVIIVHTGRHIFSNPEKGGIMIPCFYEGPLKPYSSVLFITYISLPLLTISGAEGSTGQSSRPSALSRPTVCHYSFL